MEAVAAFLISGALFLLLAYGVRLRALRPTEARVRALSPRLEHVGSGDEAQVLLRRGASGIPRVSQWLNASGYADRWAFDLERAGVRLRAGEYLLLRLVLASVAGAIVLAAGRALGPAALLLAFVVAIPAFMAPAFWVSMRIMSRIKKIERQLVETITLIENALRAGFAFSQGVDVAAERIGPPMSLELNRLLLDVSLGASMEDALHAMNDRIRSDDLDMVITAILIQRTTGGNLAEVLHNVTETIRDRERIKGEINTMTAQQRLTGRILTVYPIAIGGVVFLINPSMFSLMWSTGLGLVLLGLWCIMLVAGYLAINRILDIDI